ncbi:MAG: hypothetical protein LH470_09285 [Lysobacter sp.]|nr:hypothetical protein [Lysobacter sp.]
MSDPAPDPNPPVDPAQGPAANARTVIVPTHPHGGWIVAILVVMWVASLAGAWFWAGHRASSAAPSTDRAQPEADTQLQQRVTTLQMSDKISRQANRELQQTLAEREEEVAGLRADVAFYERLVGSTGRRKGLSVHDVELHRDSDGSWRYTAMLTQNLNRGAVSKGGLTLSVEGTRGGKLARLGWDDLLQTPQAPPQRFEFRYFQRLEGSLLLPQGFVPGRVIAQLKPDRGGSAEQAFAWAEAATAATK